MQEAGFRPIWNRVIAPVVWEIKGVVAAFFGSIRIIFPFTCITANIDFFTNDTIALGFLGFAKDWVTHLRGLLLVRYIHWNWNYTHLANGFLVDVK